MSPDMWEETRFGLRKKLSYGWPIHRNSGVPQYSHDKEALLENQASKHEAKKKPKKVTPEKKREYNRRYYKKHIHGKPRTKVIK